MKKEIWDESAAMLRDQAASLEKTEGNVGETIRENVHHRETESRNEDNEIVELSNNNQHDKNSTPNNDCS